MPDDPTKPPRFPYVAALLCAACVGVAAWTWMRYSCAQDVVAEDFWTLKQRPADPLGRIGITVPIPGSNMEYRRNYALVGDYVCLRGKLDDIYPEDADVCPGEWAEIHGREAALAAWAHPVTGLLSPNDIGTEVVVVGRVVIKEGFTGVPNPVVDPMRSRFTGASVAGLVVGAMGVFVFTVALRHWLGERRRFLEDTRRHNPSVETVTL